ncbi:YrhA family protein [Serratia rubidaea]|uniref:YrhA family protein n=1 Tax=Serratia rubidaea TaxID=61652 RepID=UPI0022B8D568|nr:YrhA family protein [Serratia rubidaea]WBF46957.1 YrhA family protein [Serratia rubidaea]
MLNIKSVVHEFQDISAKLGNSLFPAYLGEVVYHDFGRGIDKNQDNFWLEYIEFARLSDGLLADSVSFFGLGYYDWADFNNLYKNNDLFTKEKGMHHEGLDGLIVVGSNDTDILVYDTKSFQWEVRDRIAVDFSTNSFSTLAELINAQILELKNIHGDLL